MMPPSGSASLATGACPECLGTMEVWFLEGIDVSNPQGTKKSGIRIMWVSKIKPGASMTEG